jgi:anthranilate/para-aminobenzoate synthase component II
MNLAAARAPARPRSRPSARQRARVRPAESERRIAPALRVEAAIYVSRGPNAPSPKEARTMTAMMSWFLSVLAILGLVLALHALGVDVMSTVGQVLHGTEHFLGQPLLQS